MSTPDLVRRKTIGGVEYETHLLPWGEALKVTTKLANLVGSGLSGAKLEGDDERAANALMSAIGEALGRLRHEEVRELIDLFVRHSFADMGTGIHAALKEHTDTLWRGKPSLPLQFVSWCVVENCADFTDAAKALVPELSRLFSQAMRRRGGNSPPASSGDSGG